MIRTRDCDHVISQGTLRNGSERIDYYTSTPTPSHWIAVGVMIDSTDDVQTVSKRKLLVGNGTSEISAIIDLNARFVETSQKQRHTEAYDGEPAEPIAPFPADATQGRQSSQIDAGSDLQRIPETWEIHQ